MTERILRYLMIGSLVVIAGVLLYVLYGWMVGLTGNIIFFSALVFAISFAIHQTIADYGGWKND